MPKLSLPIFYFHGSDEKESFCSVGCTCFFFLLFVCIFKYVTVSIANQGTMLYQGKIFQISFSQDNPFLLAIGGLKGKLQVHTQPWNTHSNLFYI